MVNLEKVLTYLALISTANAGVLIDSPAVEGVEASLGSRALDDCGGSGETCCFEHGLGLECERGFVCDYGSNTCKNCGGAAEEHLLSTIQMCCPGMKCRPGYGCSPDGLCHPCGLPPHRGDSYFPGQRCCPGPGPSCVAGSACSEEGYCEACGGEGELCCDGMKCNKKKVDYYEEGGAEGGTGEGDGTEAYVLPHPLLQPPQENLVCNHLNTCVQCGDFDEPCCDGMKCNSVVRDGEEDECRNGLTCTNSMMCDYCGGVNQPSCQNGGKPCAVVPLEVCYRARYGYTCGSRGGVYEEEEAGGGPQTMGGPCKPAHYQSEESGGVCCECRNVPLAEDYDGECVPPFPTHNSGCSTCDYYNPCTKAAYEELGEAGNFFFPHCQADMYIQCSQYGKCLELCCANGFVWDNSVSTCVPFKKPGGY